MTTPSTPATLARLLLRHQLAVRFDLLPLESIEELEAAIARLVTDLGIDPGKPVLRCVLGSCLVGDLLAHGKRLRNDFDLVAAQVLMLGYMNLDPLGPVLGAETYELMVAGERWEELFDEHSSVPWRDRMKTALYRFITPAMVERWDAMRNTDGVEPERHARMLLVALTQEESRAMQGPAFDLVDLAALESREPHPSTTP